MCEEVEYASLIKELRHPKLEQQERTTRARSARERMRQALAGIDRLIIVPRKVQDSACWLTAPSSASAAAPPPDGASESAAPGASAKVESGAAFPLSPAGHVIIILPHAHVTPDEALRCLRFDGASLAAQAARGRTPAVSMVQLPCCAFVWHDTALGLRADFEQLDARIATPARSVRVWRDVASRFCFEGSQRGRGVPRQRLDLSASNARKRGET